jgi:hypothetical protein
MVTRGKHLAAIVGDLFTDWFVADRLGNPLIVLVCRETPFTTRRDLIFSLPGSGVQDVMISVTGNDVDAFARCDQVGNLSLGDMVVWLICFRALFFES